MGTCSISSGVLGIYARLSSSLEVSNSAVISCVPPWSSSMGLDIRSRDTGFLLRLRFKKTTIASRIVASPPIPTPTPTPIATPFGWLWVEDLELLVIAAAIAVVVEMGEYGIVVIMSATPSVNILVELRQQS